MEIMHVNFVHQETNCLIHCKAYHINKERIETIFITSHISSLHCYSYEDRFTLSVTKTIECMNLANSIDFLYIALFSH